MSVPENAVDATEIVILTPEVEAGGGGVADYTLRIVEQWEGAVPVRFIVPKREGQPDVTVQGHSVGTTEQNARALLHTLPERGGKVLLQYSAYGFQHFGYPRWLLRALSIWKRKSGGRLVVMFHEIWTFWPVLNKNYPLQQLHRFHLRRLTRDADAVFTSTSNQAEHLRKLCPACAVTVLPVGTNIRPETSSPGPREKGLAVLFGLQAARIHTLRKMQNDLESLASRQIIRKLIAVGVGQSSEGDRLERDLLGKLRLAGGYEQRPALAESEVSALLYRASFGVSQQDESSVTKSGTAMAYAAHGLTILARFASLSQPPPLCWATSPAELRQGIPEEQLRERAVKLREWQRDNGSWPHIAEQFARALQIDPALPPLS